MPIYQLGTFIAAFYHVKENGRPTGARLPWCYPRWCEWANYTVAEVPNATNPFLENSPRLPGITKALQAEVVSYINRFGELRSDGRSIRDRDLRLNFERQNEDVYAKGRRAVHSVVHKIFQRKDFSRELDTELTGRGVNLRQISQYHEELFTTGFTASDREKIEIKDALVTVLLGPEAFSRMDAGRRAYPACYDGAVSILFAAYWNRLRGRKNRAVRKFEEAEKSIEAKMSSIQTLVESDVGWKSSEAKHAILDVVKDVQRHIENATWLGQDHILEALNTRRTEAQELLGKYSSNVPLPSTGHNRFSRAIAQNIEHLCTEDEAHRFEEMYSSLHATVDAESNFHGDSTPISSQDPSSQALAQTAFEGDLGVSEWRASSPEALRSRLGWSSCADSKLMQHWRHLNGATAFTEPAIFAPLSSHGLSDPAGAEFSRQKLHWHQLAGICSVISRHWAEGPKDGTEGVLVADEVGVGKTGLGIGVIAFTSEQVEEARQNRPPAPIIRDRPFLGHSSALPERPHLILVPNALVGQWTTELRTWLAAGAWDIFTYCGGSKSTAQFWEESGPFRRSRFYKNGQLSRIIIVASHNSAVSDMKTTTIPFDGAMNPWEVPKTQPNLSEDTINRTLYPIEWLTVLIDEGHKFRSQPWIASHFKRRSCVFLIATATPLYTRPLDLVHLGCILGIRNICCERFQELYRALDASSNRAKRHLSRVTKRQLPQELDEDEKKAALLQHAEDVDIAMKGVAESSRAAVLMVKEQFGDLIIRRTTDSLNFEGLPINALPPYTQQRDREVRVLSPVFQAGGNISAEISRVDSPYAFVSRNFYVDYRRAITTIECTPGSSLSQDTEGPQRREKTITPPPFVDRADYDRRKSTKVDVLLHLVQHILSGDDTPTPVFTDDGAMPTFPKHPNPGYRDPRGPDRVVIWQEFQSLSSYVSSALEVHNIPVSIMNGNVSTAKRDKILGNFRRGKDAAGTRDCFVLLITNVVGAGYNIACASHMILLDQPWSAQDMRQIVGRVWRQPQEKVVKLIRLLAINTTDIMMSGSAGVKAELLDVFFDKPELKAIADVISGAASVGIPSEGVEESEPDDAEMEVKTRRGGKRGTSQRTRKRKGADSAATTGEERPPRRLKKSRVQPPPTETVTPLEQTPGRRSSYAGDTTPPEPTGLPPDHTHGPAEPLISAVHSPNATAGQTHELQKVSTGSVPSAGPEEWHQSAKGTPPRPPQPMPWDDTSADAPSAYSAPTEISGDYSEQRECSDMGAPCAPDTDAPATESAGLPSGGTSSLEFTGTGSETPPNPNTGIMSPNERTNLGESVRSPTTSNHKHKDRSGYTYVAGRLTLHDPDQGKRPPARAEGNPPTDRGPPKRTRLDAHSPVNGPQSTADYPGGHRAAMKRSEFRVPPAATPFPSNPSMAIISGLMPPKSQSKKRPPPGVPPQKK
ncbi:hypothetical protein BS47DRAFT_1361249 [Hydnum rufescens UP504]|uniref:Uncharacterized protein n=1 Tax=Hydnum rufescens UP504 TaxID=1448309 RepID=A0A9P6B026_9AGAM|nr:hypothetical protein BS47DRAFT_1361249 [Hydnum rufescens UP504]